MTAVGSPEIVPMVDLPGLTTRPLTLADSAAAHAVIAAEEELAIGRCDLTVADVVADWSRPTADLATCTLGCFDADRLVAFAQLDLPDRVDAGVLPRHHGRGIGTALARWLRERARAAGSVLVGQQVPADSPADRFLAAQGYRARWTAWDLALPPGTEIPPRDLPRDWRLEDADDARLVEAWRVVEDAFDEWEREPVDVEDFRALVRARPGSAPWNLRVAVDPGGVVRGAAHVVLAGDDAHVTRLAVHRGARGRGIGQALLVDAFRLGRTHGATRSTLSTDSRGHAVSLYEKVGMVVDSTWVNRAVEL